MLSVLRPALHPGFLPRPCARPRLLLHPIVSPFVRTITKRYTEEHELLNYDETTSLGRLHITKYASKSLGDVVFVELPKVGREVKKGEQIGAVESVKAASDIYSPVTGTVCEINETLGEKPSLMSSDPESAGWLCDLKVSDSSELDSLLTPEAYETFCQGKEQ